jgi:hypothetical protein
LLHHGSSSSTLAAVVGAAGTAASLRSVSGGSLSGFAIGNKVVLLLIEVGKFLAISA